MVEVDTTYSRVYAALVVNGAPVYVRFDDEEAYNDFLHGVNHKWEGLQAVTGYDNADLLIRPASVDIVLKGSKPQ